MTRVIHSAKAPPTIANIGPGFDNLGIAVRMTGDVVDAELTPEFTGVKLVDIVNNPGLPLGPENVVEAVGAKIFEDYAAKNPDLATFGVKLVLHKNMEIGSGRGSSASSSVAAAMAVNSVLGEFTDNPFKKDSEEMIRAVVYGEQVACGSPHADNVLPSLLGGLVLIYDAKEFKYMRFNVPEIPLVVVQPNLSVSTRAAREALKPVPYNIGELVKETGALLKRYINGKCEASVVFGPNFGLTPRSIEATLKPGGSHIVVAKYMAGAINVMQGLLKGDFYLLGKGVMQDEIITPVRAKLIEGYDIVVKAGLEAGAYGLSISGSGPSIFFVPKSVYDAYNVASAVEKVWGWQGIESRASVTQVNNLGATVTKSITS